MEAQRLGWHGEHVVFLQSEDSDVSRQSWLQFQVHIGRTNHHLISHHITLSGSLLAHLRHGALKGIFGEGVDSERHTLTFFHTANISLVDVSNHTHIRQILGDGEEFWGIE